MSRSVTTIVQSMMSYIKSKFSTADVVEGGILNDVVMTAPARIISQLYSDLDTASQGQAIETAPDVQLDILGRNVGIVRKAARPARGTITFYKNTAPSSDVVIPVGAVVSTAASNTSPGIQFQTLYTVTMYASLASLYLNPITGRYEISTDIIAALPGLDGIVGGNTISLISTPVANIDGAYNATATAYGADQESSISLQNRIGARTTGNSIGTEDGYLSVVVANSNVEDAIVVAHGLTGRDTVGAIDIYVKGRSPVTQTDVFSFLTSDMIFSKQPTISGSVVSVQSSSSGSISSSLWQQIIDTGVYRGSIEALDKLHWPTVLNNTYGIIYATYSYNALIEQLQTLFSQTNKDVLDTNVLVKWAQELPVDLTINMKVSQGFDSTTVSDAVSTELALFLDSLTIGQELQQADVARIILNVAGVDDVQLPFTLFRSSDNTVLPNTFGNLVIPAYSYTKTGTITINIVATT
jgi:uncharacterized phage protein gp47/JayE